MSKRALAVVALFASCAAAAQTPIAIETLFRRPEYASVRLSPDGNQLAAIIPGLGRSNLAVVDLKTMRATPVAVVKDADVIGFTWIGTKRLALDLGDLGDASGQVYRRGAAAVDIDGSNAVRTQIATGSILYRFSGDDDVLVVRRDGQSTQVFRESTRKPRERGTLLTFDNPGRVWHWVVDHAGNVRVAVSYDRDHRENVVYYRRTGDSPWREIARHSIERNEATYPLAFDYDNKTLLVRTNVGADRFALHRFDPESGKLLDKVFESAEFDVGAVLFDNAAKRIAGIVSGDTPSGITWIDPHWQRVQDGVDKALPNLRNRLSWGNDNTKRVLVTSYSDVQPAKFWLLDAESGRMEELASSRKWIDPAAMTRSKRVHYTARDGTSIPARMLVPKSTGERKPPLVVMIHGGPYVEGYGYGFNAEAQFFASRGYAVLMPDFRGTRGYGRKFLEAGYRQWGRAMQDDITDGVKWAIAQGLVDAARVCLFGASYGGYAALMGLVREPDMFRCAVAEVAVTDPFLLFDVGWDRAVGIEENEATRVRWIGDPDKDRAQLEAVSPLHQAKRIKAPVLLAFGGEDRRVPIIHGTGMRNALQQNGTPVEYVMYPDEAHGFSKDENRFDFYRRVEKFLADNLAAR